MVDDAIQILAWFAAVLGVGFVFAMGALYTYECFRDPLAGLGRAEEEESLGERDE